MKLSFVRQHSLGLVAALIIGVVVALPPIWFHFSSAYQGIDMLKTNTEEHYVAQIQEAFDGHHNLGNPFLGDLKNEPYLFPILSPNIIWVVGKILFLKTIPAVLVTRFLCSALLAFIIYLFVFNLTKSRITGLIAAPFVMLGYGLVDPNNFIALLKTGVLPSEMTFLHYARPINPNVSALFFFGYLFCLWRYLYEPVKNKWYGLLSTLILGLSFYVYLFTWTFIFVFNGMLIIVFLFKHDREKIKKIVWLSLLALPISIFYWINYWNASQSPWYAETATRFGFVKTHAWNISKLVIIAAVAFATSYRILDERVRVFFVAFFPTAFFVVNEQVVTGYYIFNHHYHWNFNTPLVIILLVGIFFALLNKYMKRKAIIYSIASVLFVVLLLCGINEQRVSFAASLPDTMAQQRYAPLIDWLNKETQKDKVIFASLKITDAIPALTHNNVYYDSTAIYTLMPTKRLEQNYLVYRYLEGVPANEIELYLQSHRKELGYFLFGYTYVFQENTCLTCFPDNFIIEMTKEYRALNDQNFISYLNRYPLDYVVWDREKDPVWKPDRFNLKIAKDFGNIVVYEFTTH